MPSTSWPRHGPTPRPPTPSFACSSPAAEPRICAGPRIRWPRPRPSSTPLDVTSTACPVWQTGAPQRRSRAMTPRPERKSRNARSPPPEPSSTSWWPDLADRRSRLRGRSAPPPRRWSRPWNSRSPTPPSSRRPTASSRPGSPNPARCCRPAAPLPSSPTSHDPGSRCGSTSRICRG